MAICHIKKVKLKSGNGLLMWPFSIQVFKFVNNCDSSDFCEILLMKLFRVLVNFSAVLFIEWYHFKIGNPWLWTTLKMVSNLQSIFLSLTPPIWCFYFQNVLKNTVGIWIPKKCGIHVTAVMVWMGPLIGCYSCFLVVKALNINNW